MPAVLKTLTVVSVALLVILACGYVWNTGPLLQYNSAGTPAGYGDINLRLERGRVVVFQQVGQAPGAAPQAGCAGFSDACVDITDVMRLGLIYGSPDATRLARDVDRVAGADHRGGGAGVGGVAVAGVSGAAGAGVAVRVFPRSGAGDPGAAARDGFAGGWDCQRYHQPAKL